MKASEFYEYLYGEKPPKNFTNSSTIHIFGFAEAYVAYLNQGQILPIDSVVPMLPKMKSNEFESYLKDSGYERIDDELLQKGTEYYCVNNVYRHFLNLIEFGN